MAFKKNGRAPIHKTLVKWTKISYYSSMFKFVIFDLDGTLVDTIIDIHQSLNSTLAHFGFPQITLSQTKSYVGDGMRKLVQRAVGEKKFNQEIETLFRKTYSENIVNNTRLFEGIPELLKEIRQKQLVAVVISNKSLALTKKIIKYFVMDQSVQEWYGGDSFNTKKPSPEPVQSAMEKFNVKKNDAVMIGDNHTDILAGMDAGVKTCFCSYGYGTVGTSRPDYYAENPEDLGKILFQ